MHATSAEDRAFGSDFEAGRLPPADFGHRAHLRLAYVHLVEHGVRGASISFPRALLGFLQRHGVDPRKYHETMTQAWLFAVRHHMEKAGETACADEFLARSEALLDREILLTHYSRERLYSDDARTRFVEPDLEPIPRYP